MDSDEGGVRFTGVALHVSTGLFYILFYAKSPLKKKKSANLPLSPPPKTLPPAYAFQYQVEEQDGRYTHAEEFDGRAASGSFSLLRPNAHHNFTYVAG